MALVHLQFDHLLTTLRKQFGKNAVDNVHNKLRLEGTKLCQSGFSKYVDHFRREMIRHRADLDVSILMMDVLSSFIQLAPIQQNKRPVVNNHFHIQNISPTDMSTIMRISEIQIEKPGLTSNSTYSTTVTNPARAEDYSTLPETAKRSLAEKQIQKDVSASAKRREFIPFPFICKSAICKICKEALSCLEQCTKPGCVRPHLKGGLHYLNHKQKRRLIRTHEHYKSQSSDGENQLKTVQTVGTDENAELPGEFSTNSDDITHDIPRSYTPPLPEYDDDAESVKSDVSHTTTVSRSSKRERNRNEVVDEDTRPLSRRKTNHSNWY